jgi:hypothetical protein
MKNSILTSNLVPLSSADSIVSANPIVDIYSAAGIRRTAITIRKNRDRDTADPPLFQYIRAHAVRFEKQARRPDRRRSY